MSFTCVIVLLYCIAGFNYEILFEGRSLARRALAATG